MLADYQKLKTRVQHYLKRIEELDCTYSEGLSINELSEKLEKNIFNLVVLGQFKRGKSTFVNALLGEELLPTAVVPLTSIVTVISYGPETEVTVYFKDGSTKKIPLERLPEYITEEKNPNNVKNVKEVRILYPSPYLQEGVHLIDTPGVGSVYQNNTDETYNYIPKVDAAIFLLSVDPPISQGECDFLVEIKKYAAKIFFVLNKIDYLSPQERDQALLFNRQVLESLLGIEGIRLFPLSAKLALEGKKENNQEKLKESGLLAFEEVLADFLMREKGNLILCSVIGKGLKRIDEILMVVGLEKKALAMTAQELEDKIAEFERQKNIILQEQKDAGYILKGEAAALLNELESSLARFREENVFRLRSHIKEYIASNANLGNRELGRRANEEMIRWTEEVFERWRPEQEKKIQQAYERMVSRFIGRANEIIDHLSAVSRNIFDLEVGEFEHMEKFAEQSDFYYLLEDTPASFMIDVSKLYYYLPPVLFRRYLVKEMEDKAYHIIDRNCGRIRYDFAQRLDRSLRAFISLFNDKIDDIITKVTGAVQRAKEMKNSNASEAEARLKQLAAQEEELNKIKNEMKELLATLQ